jgi:hypothetical protein
MALVGYEAQREQIAQKIADLQKQLGQVSAVSTTNGAAKPRRKLSAAARKSIADAQKKRWAAYKKQKAAA